MLQGKPSFSRPCQYSYRQAATSTRRATTTRTGTMFFLIRMAFWFSLVLLALPFDTASDDPSGQASVSPIQALVAAGEAVGDLSGLCERKPDVCETGKSAMHTVTVRALKTARIAAEMLDESDPAAQPDTKTTTGSVAQGN